MVRNYKLDFYDIRIQLAKVHLFIKKIQFYFFFL
jgi:hypothetical protein